MELTGLGMGTWAMGDHRSNEENEITALRYGLDNGINVVDTAEMYGEGKSELLVGKAVKDYDRSKLFIISKFYPYNATKVLERKSLKQSLLRLGTDYLDLYLLHWRGNTPLEETVSGLRELQKEGLIKHWGVSNFDVSDMEELFRIPGGQECFANEVLYNIDRRGVEYDLLPWQINHNVNFIGYSPFNSGSGNSIQVTDNLIQVANNHSVNVHQIMLAWVLRSQKILSIPKASSIEHLQENIAAKDIILSTAELDLLNQDFPPVISKQPLNMI